MFIGIYDEAADILRQEFPVSRYFYYGRLLRLTISV